MSVPKVKLTIDLDKLFGAPVNDSSLRQAIGGAIIERIKERTADGIDKSGRPFKKYSAGYTHSLSFKAFGKSSGNVDLKLTGDMLDLMDIIKDSANKIQIGWSDVTQNAKAYNHTTGDTLPKRDFLGLPKRDLEEIKSQFEDQVAEFNQLDELDGQDARDKAVELIKKIQDLQPSDVQTSGEE